MGVDIHFLIVKYDKKSRLWEPARIYNSSGEPIDVYGYRRNHLMFEYLKNKLLFTSKIDIDALDHDAQTEIKEAIEYGYGHTEINFADLRFALIHLRNVLDDTEYVHNDRAIIDRSLTDLINGIQYYIDFATDHDIDVNPSDFKVLFWFDN